MLRPSSTDAPPGGPTVVHQLFRLGGTAPESYEPSTECEEALRIASACPGDDTTRMGRCGRCGRELLVILGHCQSLMEQPLSLGIGICWAIIQDTFAIPKGLAKSQTW